MEFRTFDRLVEAMEDYSDINLEQIFIILLDLPGASIDRDVILPIDI